MSEQNRAVVDRINEEVLRQGNAEVLDELVTDDFVEHNPPPGIGEDREGFKDFVRYRHEAFADQRLEIHDQVAAGDRVVERWSLTANHVGEFIGVPATGKRVTITGIDISRLADGRVAEHWSECDMLGLMEQLGAGSAQETAVS